MSDAHILLTAQQGSAMERLCLQYLLQIGRGTYAGLPPDGAVI
jgi:hypothetical protein